MATMASASTNQTNLLSNGINTNKDAQCSYCEATGHYYKNCPKVKKKKEMKEKDGKKPQRPTTHHVTQAGKRTIQLKDVGKALAPTCVPRDPKQSKRMQMLQLRKANLKQPVTHGTWVERQSMPFLFYRFMVFSPEYDQYVL